MEKRTIYECIGEFDEISALTIPERQPSRYPSSQFLDACTDHFIAFLDRSEPSKPYKVVV
ncbi:hypothetical protein ACS5Q2_16215 [Cereibacter sphaeroides]